MFVFLVFVCVCLFLFLFFFWSVTEFLIYVVTPQNRKWFSVNLAAHRECARQILPATRWRWCSRTWSTHCWNTTPSSPHLWHFASFFLPGKLTWWQRIQIHSEKQYTFSLQILQWYFEKQNVLKPLVKHEIYVCVNQQNYITARESTCSNWNSSNCSFWTGISGSILCARSDFHEGKQTEGTEVGGGEVGEWVLPRGEKHTESSTLVKLIFDCFSVGVFSSGSTAVPWKCWQQRTSRQETKTNKLVSVERQKDTKSFPR